MNTQNVFICTGRIVTASPIITLLSQNMRYLLLLFYSCCYMLYSISLNHTNKYGECIIPLVIVIHIPCYHIYQDQYMNKHFCTYQYIECVQVCYTNCKQECQVKNKSGGRGVVTKQEETGEHFADIHRRQITVTIDTKGLFAEWEIIISLVYQGSFLHFYNTAVQCYDDSGLICIKQIRGINSIFCRISPNNYYQKHNAYLAFENC